MTFEQIDSALKGIQIGHPIQAFSPTFTLSKWSVEDDYRYKLRAIWKVRDRIFGSWIEIENSIVFDGFTVNSEMDVARHVRTLMHKFLTHEADESIVMNGERVFDPHAILRPIDTVKGM